MKSLFSVFQSNMLSSIASMFENDIFREALISQHLAIYDAIMHRQPSTTKKLCINMFVM